MNKPEPKDYPPLTPHDLEWGGVGQKYYEDLQNWEKSHMKKKVAVAMIVKNEEALLARCLESVKEADAIYILE